ncbi:Fanconi anemia group M protein isoform X2 [Manduca sexta]|uniref:Fanconi anemia group M protein isoform X2 n=1 Tax=Manduca sexta TaxID=7130 RepID=UPI001183F3E6|nr:Fanconi anemia group M protein isoform X2 [Manduca sexta]
MSSVPTSSKAKSDDDFEDEDIFDDSIFLDNFGNSSFKKNKLSSSLFNDSANKSGLNVSALCCDEEISGYDKLTGKTWIYPTNYPVSDYQFNIIKAAILKNTLVSLPTGLGKTFIAAVIMYNFYRWYPVGKIVFTAPTRPLIAQQIEACYNIIAIPPADTIEMTGHMQATTRQSHWINKRVFFATPQVVYNDIKSGICPGDKIRCLVIDEAHRARKNYAYCQIVSCLDDIGHKTYRLLALSATPGSKVEDVVSVINSLHIAHLELRTEECIDVAPYSYSRKINTVIVQLGPELMLLRQNYIEILDVYARRLKQLNILPQNLGNLSKGRIVMLYKEFQSKDRGSRHPQHNYIMKDFTILIALYHGLELLLKHGSRVFLNFFDEHPEKSWIQADDKLTSLLERLRDDLGINPMSLNTSILPDGTIPEIPKHIRFGHPKFDKLKEIMMEHFTAAKKKGVDTRAIVFCEYRESVNLVNCLLLQCRPLITPQTFVGQGASGKDGKTQVSQKQQLRVMRAFRAGACNTLVATCVAEEGLDVGAVDLILCFDISTRSPIRLVQRCGRTGRERSGQVHILVTEGREHQTLMDCMRQRDGLNKKILQSKEVENSLYGQNPRMIPHDFMPACEKMYITVAKKSDVKKGNTNNDLKGQKDLRTMLLDRGASSAAKSKSETSETSFLIESEFNELFPEGFVETNYFEESKEYFSMPKDSMKTHQGDKGRIKLYTWLEWQRNSQKTVTVGHSKDSDILTELLRFSDAKRFESQSLTQSLTSPIKSSLNVPSSPAKPVFPSSASPSKTVTIVFPSPKKTKVSKKKQKVETKSPAKNNGDIRALFSTTTKSTKNYTKLITDLGIPNDGSIPTSIINLLVDLNLNNSSKKCYVCDNLCKCTMITHIKSNKFEPSMQLQFLIDPHLPDINLIQHFDTATILKCKIEKENSHNISERDRKQDIHCHDGDNNFDLDFDIETSNESSPKNVVKHSKDDIDASTNFDIGDIDDIFNDNTPPEPNEDIKENVEENKTEGETLKFFGLNSIEDIFADYDDSSDIISDDKNMKVENNNINIPMTDSSPKPTVRLPASDIPEQPLSPSILSGQIRNTKSITSPILCSQSRRLQLNTKKNTSISTPKAKKRLTLGQSDNNDDSAEEIEVTKTSLVKTSQRKNISDKSMLTITQLVEMVNKSGGGETNVNVRKNTSPEHNIIKERSVSPILLTQAEKRKSFSSNPNSNISQGSFKINESIIILESDSDSDDAEICNHVNDIMNKSFAENVNIHQPTINLAISAHDNNILKTNTISPTTSKRKLEIDDFSNVTNSPYFNKRQKLQNQDNKQISLQEKILSVLKSDKSSVFKNNHTNLHCTVSQPQSNTPKENCNPQFLNHSNKDDITKSKLEMLQMYRRDNKIHESVRNKVHTLFKDASQQPTLPQKRRIEFDESDDDFEDNETKNDFRSPNIIKYNNKASLTKNHKKRRKENSFLDLEAEQSDDSRSDSGDELSDDSIGSVAEFICDENITHHEDMHAHYIKSVRSPLKVKGGFKIPELPKRFNRADILSQYVEEDEYEMDSFCVDSHIGLTQVNDVSELELAEIILENKKKSKRNGKVRQMTQPNDDSPVIKRRNKKSNRQIHSDSDDSS